MTFEDWWSDFCKKQGGGYHWQVQLMEMKDSFKEAYDYGQYVPVSDGSAPDLTYQEAYEYWRDQTHRERKRADQAEARERLLLQSDKVQRDALVENTSLRQRIKGEQNALLYCAGSLAAAISLLEKGGKEAAPSDKMFAVMLEDYKKALNLARSFLNNEGK